MTEGDELFYLYNPLQKLAGRKYILYIFYRTKKITSFLNVISIDCPFSINYIIYDQVHINRNRSVMIQITYKMNTF